VKPITQPSRTSLRAAAAPEPGRGNPRVSVVIPTHNRAGLVVRAVRSVLGQTVTDLELIVVDDASTDGTVDALSGIDDARLRVVRLPRNARQAHATNVGIARASGEFVAFLDDDDEWLPDKLEKQLARLHEAPYASAAYCRCYVQASGELRPPSPRTHLPEGDITDGLLSRRMALTPSAFLVRRSALLQVGGFDERLTYALDLDLWLRLAQARHQFVIANEPLVIYHMDAETSRVTTDAVARLDGFLRIDRRWGALMNERLGTSEYERWRRNSTKTLTRAHEKLVAKMERRGDRRAAWRYVRAMWRQRWACFVPRALAVALFGRLPYRLRGPRRVTGPERT
jgi:glycosyltransferase involved in cell wall biosynthesis